MAMTKAEAAKLTQDMMLRGVIETIVQESRLLQVLPFMEVTGTALTYNREATMPAASFYDVGDTWTEATPTFTQVTAPLRILGGDADVDNFVQQTYADPNDIEAEVIASRAKSVAHKYSGAFFVGDSAVDTKSFDGLTKAIPAGQTFAAGANGGNLTLDLMDQVNDLVKPGKPDALFMSKRSRRKLSSLRRSSGNLLETDVDAFGQRALYYDGIPILVDDFVPDNQVKGSSGGVCSSIY
ncbi:MAG TPA: phage major capsid protein, partial [Thermomicrobiales bacterium]|nr:phage major capsid protein [Thermomicrobiales bacterium]